MINLRYIAGLLGALLIFATPLWAQDKEEACDSAHWYCVEALNVGLPAVPSEIDRETPRATMESLVRAVRRDDWVGAAHLLDLSDIREDRQQQVGTSLIRQLETVISRKTVIDWDKLLDRPDALDATATSDRAMAGTPRKSLLLWTLDMEDYPASIRLNRIKAEDGEPVWVFSRHTVQNIPRLYERYGPGRLETMLPDVLTQNTVVDLAVWELIGLPVLIVLAIYVARLVWLLTSWVAQRIPSRLAQQMLNSVRGPACVVVSTLFVMVLEAKIFSFSAELTTILVPTAWLGLIGAGLWFVVNCVEVILDHLTKVEETDLTLKEEVHKRTTATRISAARRVFVVAVVLVGGGIFLSQTNVFQNLGLTLLGTAGAVTLVLGFAARSILSNIMSSLQIALNGSAKIGDRIVFNDALCHVERIHFTYVQLRDWDGTRLVVPVTEFVSTPFKNWTMQEPEMLRIVKIKLSHAADVDALRDAFDKVIDEMEDKYIGKRDDACVRVGGQDVLGMEVWFLVPCADPNTSWEAACDAREGIVAEIHKLAEKQGVEYFPQVSAAEESVRSSV
ncbi:MULTISPECIES: mechanosensitive ion channel family protein [unclassified Sulfitobacter]|uniref:mechanosensitive ion channel family protein n=1 Tax=unclassified Sulfitobacter TaxID=196795 RepID=UPI001EF0DF70|nr:MULTISPECIES: mechanosensitive ion channel domain-containing protein [unclassified Sulfitobacter]